MKYLHDPTEIQNRDTADIPMGEIGISALVEIALIGVTIYKVIKDCFLETYSGPCDFKEPPPCSWEVEYPD